MSNIVLVGAGGTGLSGIAGILWNLGFENLVCIDSTQSQLTDKLKDAGIKVIIGHGNYEVQRDDFVIYSEAVVDSIEVKVAKSFEFDTKKYSFVMNYFQFLGEISKYFKTVGIAGTNGKSTTTSLMINTAIKCLDDFGLGILGALVPDFGNKSYLINPNHKNDIKNIFNFIFTNKDNLNYEILKKYYFVVEACEYKRHFLNLDLDYLVITNMEVDHLDYYKDEDDYQEAFLQLANKTKKNVFLLKDDRHLQDFQKKLGKKIIPVKTEEFDFKYLLGKHQNFNGSFVSSVLEKIFDDLNLKKVDLKNIKIIIESFGGLRRRMELVCSNNLGALIYSDYGHVAESIGLGYEALRTKYPDKKIFVIFQPHQMRRIVAGWGDFKKFFKLYDKVVIFDIYAARESMDIIKSLNIGDVKNIQELGNVFAKECGGEYFENFDDISKQIEDLDSERIVVIFTAGDLDYKIRKFYGKF